MSELQRYLLAREPVRGESERTRKLALLEAYYHGTQYQGLPRAWDESLDETTGTVIPFRHRRPSTIVPLPQLMVDTFVRGLWSVGRRPLPVVRDGQPTENRALADLVAEAGAYRTLRDATRRALTIGTGCVAWKVLDGRYSTESWDAKWCVPTFRPGRFPELDRLEWKFPFTVEEGGRTITKWHREVIDAETWTVYADAEVTADSDPIWREDSALSVDHGLGFCPAVWFTIGERSGAWDGTSIFGDLLSLCDDLNYTASQQARALYANLDPQTILIGVPEVDIGEMQKRGSNVWPLPAGADAKLLESRGEYITSADTRLDCLRRWALDAAAVVINDPERVSGGQSGSALELLAAPMAARITDLREDVGDCALVPLLEQMMRETMPGVAPRVLLHWGSTTPSTTADANQAVTAAAAAVEAGIVSKAAAARFVAPFLGIVDSAADQAAIDEEEEPEAPPVEPEETPDEESDEPERMNA